MPGYLARYFANWYLHKIEVHVTLSLVEFTSKPDGEEGKVTMIKFHGQLFRVVLAVKRANGFINHVWEIGIKGNKIDLWAEDVYLGVRSNWCDCTR